MSVLLVIAGCDGGSRTLAPVQTERIATLGDDAGGGVIAANPQVSGPARDGARVVVAASAGIPTPPQIFGADGRFLGVLRPKADSQPGIALFARIGPGDSIWVFDDASRATVYGNSRGYQRQVELPFVPWDAIVLPDSRILLAPANADRPLPIDMLNPDGTVAATFGDSADASIAAPRWLLRAGDGSIWSMPTQRRWQLEHWDSTGRKLPTPENAPAWFPTMVDSTSRRPQPEIRGIWSDSTGAIWVLGQVADAHWRRGLDSTTSSSIGAVVRQADDAYDTMIDVLSSDGTRHLLTTRVDPSYQSLAGPGVLIHLGDTRHGWKRLELLTVRRGPTR